MATPLGPEQFLDPSSPDGLNHAVEQRFVRDKIEHNIRHISENEYQVDYYNPAGDSHQWEAQLLLDDPDRYWREDTFQVQERINLNDYADSYASAVASVYKDALYYKEMARLAAEFANAKDYKLSIRRYVIRDLEAFFATERDTPYERHRIVYFNNQHTPRFGMHIG